MKRQRTSKRPNPEVEDPTRKKPKAQKADQSCSRRDSDKNVRNSELLNSTEQKGNLENTNQTEEQCVNFEELLKSEFETALKKGVAVSDGEAELLAGSSDNSELEFTSGSNKSSEVEHKEGSNDESNASLSPISFGNSDDNLEHLDLIKLDECALSTASGQIALSPIPSEPEEVSAPTVDPAKTRAQSPVHKGLPNQLFCQEPLSLIAEAMQSTGSTFSAFKSSEPTEKKEPPEKSLKTPKSKSTEALKKFTKSDKHESPTGSKTAEKANNRCSDKKRMFEETMTSYLTKMSRTPSEKKDKSNILPTDTNFSPASAKETDSDDSAWRRKAQTSKSDVNNAKDFYEDDSTFEEDKINSDDDEDNMTSDLPYSNVLNDYEQLFHELRKIVDKVPNRFKYEIYCLMYPTLAVVYLRMIACGKHRKGKAFVESSMRFIDHSYMARVDKLLVLQTPADMPIKARKLISDDSEQVPVCMNEETYNLLLLHMESWSRAIQLTFMRHFDLYPDEKRGEPRQISRIGAAILEKVYWASADNQKEKKEGSPKPLRRRRFKKDKPSPTRNVNLPTGNRLYTPTPKRWDLERHKDDEERRVPLDRNNLPSAYVYTAMETVETVICATFSNKSTMLSIGTASSAIHVFSLTASKLVQLKSAKFLKRLDRGVSGIDDSMLDPTKKKMRRTLYGHQGPVYDSSFAPHDRFLLSCSQDRTVRCWCLLSWSCVVIYPGHCAAIYSVSYAPLGYYFATSSDDRTARIWTQDSKKSVCILAGHLAEVICCHFHPNRHYLATGSADCTVRIWDIVKAVQVRLFSGHRDAINTLAYSICGRYLISGSDDHYIMVWDTEKEELMRCLSFHTAAVNCIEFGMDNKLFVAGGQDCQMSIWDFERLIKENDHNKLKQNAQNDDSDRKRSGLSSRDFLVKSFPSRGTPFYKLRITRRNLLLGCCVRLAKDALMDVKQPANMDEKYSEWLEFLDILKLKACFAQPNMGESNKLNAPCEMEDSEVSKNSDEDTERLRNSDVDSSENEEESQIDAKKCKSSENGDKDSDTSSSSEDDEESSKNHKISLRKSDFENIENNKNKPETLRTSDKEKSVETVDEKLLKNTKAVYYLENDKKSETSGDSNGEFLQQNSDAKPIEDLKDTDLLNSDIKFNQSSEKGPFEKDKEESALINNDNTNTESVGLDEQFEDVLKSFDYKYFGFDEESKVEMDSKSEADKGDTLSLKTTKVDFVEDNANLVKNKEEEETLRNEREVEKKSIMEGNEEHKESLKSSHDESVTEVSVKGIPEIEVKELTTVESSESSESSTDDEQSETLSNPQVELGNTFQILNIQNLESKLDADKPKTQEININKIEIQSTKILNVEPVQDTKEEPKNSNPDADFAFERSELLQSLFGTNEDSGTNNADAESLYNDLQLSSSDEE